MEGLQGKRKITLKSCSGSSNFPNDSKRVFRCDVKISICGSCDSTRADGYCCYRGRWRCVALDGTKRKQSERLNSRLNLTTGTISGNVQFSFNLPGKVGSLTQPNVWADLSYLHFLPSQSSGTLRTHNMTSFQLSWARITFKLESVSGFNFTTALAVNITAMINYVFTHCFLLSKRNLALLQWVEEEETLLAASDSIRIHVPFITSTWEIMKKFKITLPLRSPLSSC